MDSQEKLKIASVHQEDKRIFDTATGAGFFMDASSNERRIHCHQVVNRHMVGAECEMHGDAPDENHRALCSPIRCRLYAEPFCSDTRPAERNQ